MMDRVGISLFPLSGGSSFPEFNYTDTVRNIIPVFFIYSNDVYN